MGETIDSFVKKVHAYDFPRRIIFGPESIERIKEEVRQLHASNGLIVTDETMEKIGYVDKVKDLLRESSLNIEVYDTVEPDPHVETADRVVTLVKKREYDVVIGLGGGSCLDMAKIASIAEQIEGSAQQYVGPNKVREKGIPLICIPTTSGTGSEVTPYLIFSVGEKKRAIASRYTVPDLALVDPILTVTMPPKITTGSGLDALSHAIESIISLDSTSFTEALALEAVRLISQSLRTAYRQGDNLEARYYMALAATTAGLAFSSARVVYGHSVAQTFAPRYNVPHGISCAMTLPYIMEFYLPVATMELAKIARAMGEPVDHTPVQDAARLAVRAVHKLTQDLNVPKLRDLGATQEQLADLAKACISDWPRTNSPRQFTEETAVAVFERIWRGS